MILDSSYQQKKEKKRKQKITSVGKDEEKLEPLYSIGGHMKYNGKLYGSSWKN